ncbi:hypothetical protein N7456_002903 [Penicillium angulare]|uniref:Uncharacterized protein n=1 Tax=Penicillium angulare TaxID=116970 RepID=A0A9W9KI39_9EURO|nr:hypothetical protein N7456_002903 [Penicillium angulare]
MKISFALLLVALATIAASEKTYNVKCETSDASPYLHNVNELIDNLNKAPQGENSCNPGPVNGCGKTVTGYSGSGGAAYMLCGEGFRCSGDPGGVPCSAGGCGGLMTGLIGGFFAKLRDECQGPDSNGDIRVGGTIELLSGGESDGTELRLFSKPG